MCRLERSSSSQEGNEFIPGREEINPHDRLYAELTKIVSGDATIRAPDEKAYVTFRPSHLSILACNELPLVVMHDDAMIRADCGALFTAYTQGLTTEHPLTIPTQGRA